MHADELPSAPLTHQNVGGSELPIVGLATVCRLLIMDADHNRAISEQAHRGIPPIECGRDKGAAAVTLKPLGFVQDETQGTDQKEIVVRHGIEHVEVLGNFRLRPALAELFQLCFVVVHCVLVLSAGLLPLFADRWPGTRPCGAQSVATGPPILGWPALKREGMSS